MLACKLNVNLVGNEKFMAASKFCCVTGVDLHLQPSKRILTLPLPEN